MTSRNLKESSVRSLITVGCRGKRKTNLSPTVLAIMTKLSNTLIKEALLRAAKVASTKKEKIVTTEDFQRIVAQLLLDFT